MALPFTYTFADFEEASSASSTIQPAKPRFRWGLYGWALFVTFTAIFFTLLRTSPQLIPPQPAPPQRDLLLLLTPHLSMALLFVAFWVGVALLTSRTRRLEARSQDAERTGKRLASTMLIVMLALLILNIFAAQMNHAGFERSLTASRELLICYLPWGLALILFGFCMSMLRRRSARVAWETHKSLHRTKRLEFDNELFMLQDDAGEHHIRWAYLTKYLETQNLLIVFDENNLMYLFPKRAFESEDEIMRFRGILHTNIAQGEFLPQVSAFPVASRPVIPLE